MEAGFRAHANAKLYFDTTNADSSVKSRESGEDSMLSMIYVAMLLFCVRARCLELKNLQMEKTGEWRTEHGPSIPNVPRNLDTLMPPRMMSAT